MIVTHGWPVNVHRAHIEPCKAATPLPCYYTSRGGYTSWQRNAQRRQRKHQPPQKDLAASCGRRAGDKCLFGFVLATLWWQLGGDYSASNTLNIAGILNFWVTMPAFGSVPCILCREVCVTQHYMSAGSLLASSTFRHNTVV